MFRPVCHSNNKDRGKESNTTINYITDINREYSKVLQTTNEQGNILDSYVYGEQRISQEDENGSRYYSYDIQGSYTYDSYGNRKEISVESIPK